MNKIIFLGKTLERRALIAFPAIIAFLFAPFGAMAAGINGTDVRKNVDLLKLNVPTLNGNASIGTVMALVIYAVLGLMGMIFIVLVILAGYNWLTATGDTDKVEKAQDTLRYAVIGLVVILAAYAITFFVFSVLSKIPSAGTNGFGNGGQI